MIFNPKVEVLNINIIIVFNILIFLLGAVAVFIFHYVRPKNRGSIRRSKYKQLKLFVENNITNDTEINKILTDLNIGLTLKKYQIIRYGIFIILLIIYLSKFILQGGYLPQQPIILLCITFLISMPRKYIAAKKTPFIYVVEIVKNQFLKEKNTEIYRAFSQLKNLSIARQNNPPGSDFILEQLRKFSKKTRPIFNEMIYYWSLGKKEDACNYFKEQINTPEAEQLADIFLKLDELNPIELKNQLILYQDKIKKKRETDKIKANEDKSYLVYSTVIASAFIVLLNFVIVGFYIDSINLFKYQFMY